MNTDIAFSSLTDLSAGLATGLWSSVELTQVFLERIQKSNKQLHAYVHVDAELALAMAQASDRRRALGVTFSALDGVPFAAKDLCELEGQITTAGSEHWRERRSQTTSTALLKSLQAGMVMLGKTHMVEFAFGGWGANPVMGTPWNPWDLQEHRIPGGSSSGSAVAVAAGLAPAAIGSDTGGSIRMPCGLNGITGLKTTRGLVSLHGAVALSNTLDTIGPMVHTVQDAGVWTSLMAGPDVQDPSSLQRPCFHWQPPQLAAKPLAGLRLAVLPLDQYPIDVDAEMMVAFDQACRSFVALGAEISELRLPFDFRDLMVRNGQIIAAEAYAQHANYIDDDTLPFGPAVRQRILSGREISAAQYIDAIAHHRSSSALWAELMRGYAALVTPQTPFAAIPVTQVDEAVTPLAAFARAGNYLTACGLTLPAGLSQTGLPLGIQLLGKSFDEATLLDVGFAFQAETDWHHQHPDLTALGI